MLLNEQQSGTDIQNVVQMHLGHRGQDQAEEAKSPLSTSERSLDSLLSEEDVSQPRSEWHNQHSQPPSFSSPKSHGHFHRSLSQLGTQHKPLEPVSA